MNKLIYNYLSFFHLSTWSSSSLTQQKSTLKVHIKRSSSTYLYHLLHVDKGPSYQCAHHSLTAIYPGHTSINHVCIAVCECPVSIYSIAELASQTLNTNETSINKELWRKCLSVWLLPNVNCFNSIQVIQMRL